MKLFVRYTHREVPLEQIDEWIALYGTIISESKFETHSTGFKSNVYTTHVKLTYLIPEYLPIRGKRAKLYYHGMPSFCTACHTVGHLTSTCTNEPATWSDYIEKLRSCEVPFEFFGTWNIDQTRQTFNSNSNLSFQTSTPSRNVGNDDEIRAQFLSFMQEFVQNPSSINSDNPTLNSNTAAVAKKGFAPPPIVSNTVGTLSKFQLQYQTQQRINQAPVQAQAQTQAQPQVDLANSTPAYRGRGYRGRGRSFRGGRSRGRGRGF